ncbi:MAG TPA: type II toxin-antitoxin system RelE/ParE family toxin [Blastocatellia bacterium]|nr:type II toxin-antitoxin system RelE/ParE family toxin [Blastocatellia bacterium]
MKVQFTPFASRQFLSAIDYISSDNPDAAAELRRRAENILRRLEQFPKSGRIIPEFPDLPFREVIVPPYRFFYRVADEIVWIVATWHSAQVPSSPSDLEN